MKYKVILWAFLSWSTISFAQAQNDSTATANFQNDTTAAISDEDLKKYAVVMDSVNDMKKELLGDITEMVKSNEKMTNARYNELSKIINDEAKLTAAKATPEEVNFIKEVAAKKEEGANEISETFQTLAKDYIGVEEYNKIKTAITEDPSLKERYNNILEEVDEDKGGAED